MPASTDTIPVKLTPGEFVIKKEAVDMIGVPLLNKLNNVPDEGGGHKAIDELKFLRENGDINVKQFDAGMESIFKKVNRYSGRKNVVGGKLTYNPNNWKNYGNPIGEDVVLKNNILVNKILKIAKEELQIGKKVKIKY